MTAVKPGTWGYTRTQHGTLSGYHRHKRRGVPVCEDCQTAHNTYHRDRYRNDGAARIENLARHRAQRDLMTRHRREYHELFRYHVQVLLARPPQPIGERAG